MEKSEKLPDVQKLTTTDMWEMCVCFENTELKFSYFLFQNDEEPFPIAGTVQYQHSQSKAAKGFQIMLKMTFRLKDSLSSCTYRHFSVLYAGSLVIDILCNGGVFHTVLSWWF